MYLKKIIKFSLLLLLVSNMFGCVKQPERIVYPFPPESPRYEWIGTFKSELNFRDKAAARSEGASFHGPMDAAVNIDGRVLVTDLYAQKVKVLDLEQKRISLFSDYPFRSIVGIATDLTGHVYVADGGAKQVLVFAQDGSWLRSIGGKDVFGKPVWLAVNDDLGRLYVSDSVAHDIKAFTLSGELLFTVGTAGGGNAPGALHAPQGIAIDSKGQLFVADKFNARIQVFSADGEYLRHFGERGSFFQQFEHPKGLAFDSEDHLYITDSMRNHFRVFDPEGQLLLVMGGEASNHPLGFKVPTGICVDSQDRVVIVDTLNGRVTLWQYLSEAYRKRVQWQPPQMKMPAIK